MSGSATTAVIATWGTWPLLWQTPFFLSFAAVLVATHFRGAAAGATTLALLTTAWLAFPPRPSPPTYLALAVFVMLGAISLWIIARAQFLQRALTAHEARLRLIVANIPIILWTIDRQGRFTLSEGRGLSAIGLSPGEVVGRTVYEVYGDIPEIIDAADRALAGESVPVTTRVAGRSFECWYAPLRASTGKLEGAIGVAADITARESAQAAVRESEARYRELVQHATHGIYRSTVDGHFVAVNAALVQMLGYGSEEELLRLPIAALYQDPGDRQRLIDRFKDSERIEGVDVEWKRQDGLPLTVRLSGRATCSDEGVREGYDMLVEDITTRRELERQLQHALKMEAIGRLAGGVAHDFNNVLTAILGYGELVLQDLPEDDPRRADVAEILSTAQRGGALTRQLLIFGRRHVSRPRIVDLSDVVTRAHRLLTRVLGEDITVTIGLCAPPLPVRIDVTQLEQVILNLAINARDAMPHGGQLTIVTERHECESEPGEVAGGGPTARLTITDTGCGMSPEVQARAFDPFFTTKPPGKGTGLGLSTAHGIVAESGGTIMVESAPECGATFRIALPIATGTVEALEETVASQVFVQGFETVLLVEDDAGVRATASSILHRHGYTVFEAHDAAEALRLADGGTRIDLLLTDVVMPGPSGIELAERLTQGLPRLRVVLMSGYHDRGSAPAAYPAGWLMIEKPFMPATLLRAVREVLDRPDPT